MDGLCGPTGVKLADHDVVPFVARQDYHRKPFLEYLDTIGANQDSTWIAALTAPEADCRLQTCFFFCILQDLLGPYYAESDYVRTTTDKDGRPIKVVTTLRLNDRLREWVTQNKSLSASARDKKITRFDSYAHRSAEVVRHLRLRASRVIKIFVATFLDAMKEAVKEGLDAKHITWPSFKLGFDKKDVIYMVEHGGWCPYEARTACENLRETPAVLSIRSLPRYTVDTRHSKCNINSCEDALKGSLSSVVMEHETSDCNCTEVFESHPSFLKSLLYQDVTPLVQGLVGTDGLIKDCRMLPAYGPQIYVAISHVWADGLGNAASNSLRMCKVHALIRKVLELQRFCGAANLVDETFVVQIWLDTLCVPATPGPSKVLALSNMIKYYREADRVLVLDREIQNCPFGADTPLLAGLYATTSRWMLRLWTLQEAVMASKLYFKFANTFVEREQFQKSSLNATRQSLPYALRSVAKVVASQSYGLAEHNLEIPKTSGKSQVLDKLHSSVRSRLVTVASDEPLCLANTMGFEVATEEDDQDGRMLTFWKHLCEQGIARQEIVFSSFPRVHKASGGRRWFPRTLLDVNLFGTDYPSIAYLGPMESESVGGFVDGGVRVRYHGLVLDSKSSASTLDSTLETGAVFLYDQQETTWYNLEIVWRDSFERDKICTVVIGPPYRYTRTEHWRILLTRQVGDDKDRLLTMSLANMFSIPQPFQDLLDHVVSSTESAAVILERRFQACQGLKWLNRSAYDDENEELSPWFANVVYHLRAGRYLTVREKSKDPRNFVIE